MKAGKQEREEQSSTEEAEAKTTTIVENITPKTLLETVRDVKHVHEAEKKVKENGGSLIDVVAEIQEKEEESDGSVNSSFSSSSKAKREGEGERGEEEGTEEEMAPAHDDMDRSRRGPKNDGMCFWPKHYLLYT